MSSGNIVADEMGPDIVKRLRDGEQRGVDGWWFVMADAASEIERLRLLCKAGDEEIKTIMRYALTTFGVSATKKLTDYVLAVRKEREARAALSPQTT